MRKYDSFAKQVNKMNLKVGRHPHPSKMWKLDN